MRRPVQRSATRLSADIRRLVALAHTTMEAASGLERNFWQRQLDKTLSSFLEHRAQSTLDGALEYLFQHDVDAYDILVESLEECSQSSTITVDGQPADVLLIAAPVLAWTRFTIGSGLLPESTTTALQELLQDHIFAAGAHINLLPTLYAIEQLPQDHSEVFALMQSLAPSNTQKTALKVANSNTATIPFLADTRYLIAAVTVPHQQAVFRWQDANDPQHIAELQQTCAKLWQQHAQPLLAPSLPGCNLALLLPHAYFFSCREADKQIRPCTILAATHYLTHHLDVLPQQLHVSIGKCSHDRDGEIDEYRIGFTVGETDDVYYGTVWPLYEHEDGNDVDIILFPEASAAHPMTIIQGLLKECGITHIKEHNDLFDAEFCDDCGSPLFPNLDGDLVHAEMPEETRDQLEQLH
jgi:hypothetical protein